MTTQEAMAYEKAIITSGIAWATGNGSIDSQIDLCILAEHYGIRLPACMHHFCYSNGPMHCVATGAHKTIHRVLTRLAAIIQKEVCNSK